METVKKIFKKEFFWLFIILSLAIFLRIYKLSEIPPGLTGDEAWLGIDGKEALNRGWIGVYIPGHAWGYNAMHAYIASLVIKLFGDGISSLRLASAIPSIIQIIGFYFLLKCFFSFQISLISLFLFSVSFWPLHFGRIAFPGISLVPLFSTFSFLFSIRALKTNNVVSFLLAGVFLGLGVNAYHYFNFTLIAIFIYLLIKIITERGFLKNHFWGLLIMISIFIIIFLPYGIFILKNPSIIKGKWEHVSIFKPENVLPEGLASSALTTFHLLKTQVGKTLGMFFSKGDPDALNGPPNETLLKKPLFFIFLLGLIVSILTLKKNSYLLFLMWLGGALSVGILTADAPNSKRIVDACTPTFLFIAFGLSLLKKKLSGTLFILLNIFLVPYTFVYNYNLYFSKYRQDKNVKVRFAYEIVKACEHFNKNKDYSYVYFYHPRTYFNYETRRFLCPNLSGEDRSREYGKYSTEKNRADPVSFVYFDVYRGILPELKKKYPNGKSWEYSDERGEFVWGAYNLGETH